jgi:hypothetical protein
MHDALADISQVTFISEPMAAVPRYRRKKFCSAAIRQFQFGDLAVFATPHPHNFRHPDAPPVSLSPRRRFPRPTPERIFVVDHPSIRPKIFWNKPLGRATSANWNVTHLPWHPRWLEAERKCRACRRWPMRCSGPAPRRRRARRRCPSPRRRRADRQGTLRRLMRASDGAISS